MNSSHSPQVTKRSASSERSDDHVVARLLVVEGEAVPGVPDRGDITTDLDPVERTRIDHRRVRPLHIGGLEDVAGQRVLDVHQDQLLVLLLVMAAQLDDRRRLRDHVGRPAQEGQHPIVDGSAIGTHFRGTWSGHLPTIGSRMACPDLLVVRVEQVRVARMERLVLRIERAEHERLEEPRHVRPVPLRRAGVRHRLHGLVLRGQGRRERLRSSPHVRVALGEHVGGGKFQRDGHRDQPPPTRAQRST